MSVLSSLVDMLHHGSRAEPARLFRWLRQQPLAESADQLIDQLVGALDAELGRVVQYLKIAHRGQIGTWKTREEIEAELTTWLGEQSPGLFESSELSLSDSPERSWRYDLRLVLRPVGGVGGIVISSELCID